MTKILNVQKECGFRSAKNPSQKVNSIVQMQIIAKKEGV